jgi:hypothetical protein
MQHLDRDLDLSTHVPTSEDASHAALADALQQLKISELDHVGTQDGLMGWN